MSRKRLNITKTLALLAVAMLPVAQTLAASCCCRSGRAVGESVSTGSQRSCCLQASQSCCIATSTLHGSCCGGESNSGSEPCRCPVGLCGIDPPMGLEPVTSTSSSEVDLRVNALATVPAAVCALNCQVAREPQLASTPHEPTSGAARCVLLCRYLL